MNLIHKTFKKQGIIIILIIVFLYPFNHTGAALQIQSSDDLYEQMDPQIQKLKDEIQQHQKNVDDLQKQQAAYEESLKIKRREISSLKNQVGILEDSMAKQALEIQTNHLQIEQNNLEIQNLELLIDHKKEEIKGQQTRIADVIRMLDKIDRKKSHLEILMIQGTLSGFFKELNELQSLDNRLKTGFDNLTVLKNDLEKKKGNLDLRQQQLDSLRAKLNANQERLDNDKSAKDQLLGQTKGQEKTFQQLLSQVKAEQNRVEAEIQNLEVEARKRLLETQGSLPNDANFIWPVSSRSVSATFHDPDYPFRYIFEHPAIDIGSTPQGTPIRAARSGYVATVKFNNTTKYAYVLIVHTGGLSTVYGHISKPFVKESDFVVQGEVIALSGGMPGGVGSGSLTTGPHLHFEVRLNGIPVDPLKYLP